MNDADKLALMEPYARSLSDKDLIRLGQLTPENVCAVYRNSMT